MPTDCTGELPDLYNIGAKLQRVKDGDTWVVTAEFPFDLRRRHLEIRPYDIDAAETWRPDTEEEREMGRRQTEWATEWFDEAYSQYDGEWPLIFESKEWKRDGWQRALGYTYRKFDGHQYGEDFIDRWGEEYLYEG